jgi:hypothetical protein
MNIRRLTSLLCQLALALVLLSACQTAAQPAKPTPTEPTATATAVPTATAAVVTTDLSKCGDEYSRPPSASSSVPEGATLDPNTVYTPTINITRAEYEAALATWQAQGIFEYEIAVSDVSFMGRGTILHVTGDKVKVLGYFYSREDPVVQATPTTNEPSEYDLENTVDGLFKHVDSILTYGVCPMRGPMAFPVAYKIEFDPALGYPSKIGRSGYEPEEWAAQGIYNTMPAHSSYTKRVEKFEIIKRRTPGMPDSGRHSP